MPELPDLQVFSKNLHQELSGKTIKKIIVHNTKKLKIPAKLFQTTLKGQVLESVYREGKELHFEFSKGDVLALHLMLKGKLYLFKKKNQQKYTIIEILFDDDTGLALTDFQGQATPTLNPQDRDAIDALSKGMNSNFLQKELSKTKATIKNLLLNQEIIRGIGNAYADEILWACRLSPFAICNKIPATKIKELARSIKTVLKNAEKKIVKKDPGIISGEIRDFLSIHNSKKTHSPTGAIIKKDTSGSRKTYYTDEQQLFK